MACTLNNKTHIPINTLPAGKLAVVDDKDHTRYDGKIVVMLPDGRAFILGVLCDGRCDWFNSDCPVLVRPLKEGELIEVKYTE